MAGGVSAWRLVADVGGTNVRFARAGADGSLDGLRSCRAADFPSFRAALEAYLADSGRGDIVAAAIAAAGPIDGDRVKITNNPWSIDRADVSAALGGAPAVLINDLEAVAAALPHLAVGETAKIGAPAVVRPEHRTMLAVNVGTGFGAASVVRRGAHWWTCPSEAGHMRLGIRPGDAGEWPPDGATVESLLSGDGLVRLYQRLAGSGRASHATPSDAGGIFASAGRDARAARAVEVMSRALGRVAGDLALATAAWGGVYLCGSVAVGWSAVADAAQFRTEFIGNGPMRGRLEQVPTAVIRRGDVALFGLAKVSIAA
jgi:glucokinase